jgi:hypothetical protein
VEQLKKQQLYMVLVLGCFFLTIVEVFDGFSAEWGASTGDLIANATGTALYVSQELLEGTTYYSKILFSFD